MRSQRVAARYWLLSAFASTGALECGLGACSSSDPPGPGGGGIVARTDAATEPRDGSTSRDGPTDGPILTETDAGPVIPDTACGAAGGTRATLYPGGAKTPLFDAVGTVGPAGARRAAQGSGDEGIVFFDANGANPSTPPIALGFDLNRMAAGGNVLGVLGVTLPDIVFQRYDGTGAVVGGGAPLAIGSGPSRDVALGQSGGAFLAVWAGAQGVVGRGVDASGLLAGPEFTLDATSQQNFSAAVVSAGASFAVLWTGYTFTGPGKTLVRTVLVTASTTAMATTHDVSSDDQAREVVQLVKTPTGYAAIVNEPGGPPSFTPHSRLLILDANGNLTVNPPPFLAGVVRGLGVAAQGSELGVVVERAGQTAAFRPFDAGGQPLGPWVCLGTTAPGLNAAAVDADGAGYAVVFGSGANRAVALTRFDRLGK